jgi:hypothetical protein
VPAGHIMHTVLCILLIFQNTMAAGLPETDAFLRKVRANLRSDRLLQSQYTYNLRQTETWLDRDGKISKTLVSEYEIFPSLEEKLTYRRLVSKNGKPLSPKEIAKQDREQEKKQEKRADESKRLPQKQAEEERKENAVIDELFRLYGISLVAIEKIESYSAIEVSFRPRTDYKPVSREARILAKIAGRAWFCEDDGQLMRVEAELIDNISFGLGILAKLNKGTKVTLVRRRINDEVWLPAEAHFSLTGRFLFKGIKVISASEFSNYKKFTVNTSVKFSLDGEPQSK